jgi:hypothetical protein
MEDKTSILSVLLSEDKLRLNSIKRFLLFVTTNSSALTGLILNLRSFILDDFGNGRSPRFLLPSYAAVVSNKRASRECRSPTNRPSRGSLFTCGPAVPEVRDKVWLPNARSKSRGLQNCSASLGTIKPCLPCTSQWPCARGKS